MHYFLPSRVHDVRAPVALERIYSPQDVAKGLGPPPFPAKTLCEMRIVDLSVVTRAGSVLGICVGALRDVTVLSPIEEESLGYELGARIFVCPLSLKRAGQQG